MTGSPDRDRSRFACRAVLREALAPSGKLDAAQQEHLRLCTFCAARIRFQERLAPLLRQRPGLPTEASAKLSTGVHERIVERAENGPLGALLAGALPVPAAGVEQGAWPEALLESGLARRTVRALPVAGVGGAGDRVSWARVKESILLEAGLDRAGLARATDGMSRRTHRHWWLGLLGTAVAAGIVLVLAQQDRPEPPTIHFRDITALPSSLPAGASFPSVDFAVVRRGATR